MIAIMSALPILMVSLGIATDLFLYNTLTPILSFVLRDHLNMTTAQVERWNGFLLAVYAMSFLTVALPISIWADHGEHRRRPLLAGALLAVVACLLLYLSQSIASLVVARALQGGSSAVVWVVGMAVVIDTVSADRRGRTMAWIMASYSASGMLSPLFAGSLYQRKGIHAALIPATVVTILDAVCRAIWAFSTRTRQSSVTPPTTVSDPPGPRAGTIVQALLRRPDLWEASTTNLVVITVFTAIDVTLAMRVSMTLKSGVITVSLMFFALECPGFFLAPLMGWLVDRFGMGVTKCIGLSTIFPACVTIGYEFSGRTSRAVAMAISLVMIGFGGNLTITALMAEFGQIACEAEKAVHPTSVDVGKSGLARSYGFFTTTLAAALLIGSLVAEAVVNSFGWSMLYNGLAVLTAVLDLIILLRTGTHTMLWTRQWCTWTGTQRTTSPGGIRTAVRPQTSMIV